MKVRVVRLLTYTYDSYEEAVTDQQRWGVPANGMTHPNQRVIIRSAVLPPELLEEVES